MAALHRYRFWIHNVAEADVDLHADSRGAQRAREPDSDPLVIGTFDDAFGPDRVRFEGKTVRLHGDGQDVPQLLREFGFRATRTSEQIDVHGRAAGRSWRG